MSSPRAQLTVAAMVLIQNNSLLLMLFHGKIICISDIIQMKAEEAFF
jgi:hypothetical protein